MGFEIRINKKNEPQPVLMCDHCYNAIDNKEDGNFLWDYHQPFELVSAEIFFTHKECNSAFEASHPDTRFGARELTEFKAI